MHNFFLSLFANNSNLPRGGKMFSCVLARASHWIHLCSELNFIPGKIERTHQHTELHFQCTLMDKVHIYIHWNWLAQKEINARNSRVTRLTIHFAGVNVAVTESSCVSSLTCTSHVYKLAVSVGCVTLFWLYALTIMLASTHVNNWTPTGTCAFVVRSNESQTELQREISDGVKLLFTRVSPH